MQRRRSSRCTATWARRAATRCRPTPAAATTCPARASRIWLPSAQATWTPDTRRSRSRWAASTRGRTRHASPRCALPWATRWSCSPTPTTPGPTRPARSAPSVAGTSTTSAGWRNRTRPTSWPPMRRSRPRWNRRSPPVRSTRRAGTSSTSWTWAPPRFCSPTPRCAAASPSSGASPPWRPARASPWPRIGWPTCTCTWWPPPRTPPGSSTSPIPRC